MATVLSQNINELYDIVAVSKVSLIFFEFGMFKSFGVLVQDSSKTFLLITLLVGEFDTKQLIFL